MFLKIIIALLFVVYFVEKCSAKEITEITEVSEISGTSETTGESSTEDLKEAISTVANDKTDEVNTHKWQEKWLPIFNKYDHNKDSLLNPLEFQSLLFNESVGFVTIAQARTYIRELNLFTHNELEFKHFKRMKPIMDFLSKKTPLAANDKLDNNKSISVQDFQKKIYNGFKGLFEEENETYEIITLLGLEEDDPKVHEKYSIIKAMLPASNQLMSLHETFIVYDENGDGFINAKELYRIVHKIQFSYTIEDALQMIKIYDDNCDNKIDFPEFIRMMSQPHDIKQNLIDMFGDVAHVTKKQIKDFLLEKTNIDVPDEELRQLDPEDKDEITLQALEQFMLT